MGRLLIVLGTIVGRGVAFWDGAVAGDRLGATEGRLVRGQGQMCGAFVGAAEVDGDGVSACEGDVGPDWLGAVVGRNVLQ